MKPPFIEPTTKGADVLSAPVSPPLRVRKTMHYRALLEAGPDAIVVVNQSALIVLVNAQAERLFGYRRDELIGQRAEILVSEHSRGQHSEQHSRFLAAPTERPTVAGLELFGLRKDGTEFPAEIRLSPLDTKGGVWVSSAIRDISDRRRTEEDLRRLAAIVACSDDAIVGKNTEGIITSWNTGAERIFGYSAREAIGQPITVLVPADRSEEVPRMLECLKRGEIVDHFETVRLRKDGKEVQIEVTVSPIRDALERIVGASTIGRDISVRKAAEKHLVQMEARYRGLLEAAPDAMVVVNQDGEIVLLNVQAEKQFGYRRDELIGQKVKNIIPEGFAERLIADGTRTAAEAVAQQIGTGLELSGRRKDGSEFPIEIMLSPLESAEGILVTAAIRDITVRKDAEKHLAQMEARYRGLLEAAPDAMVVVNQDGEIVLLNLQAERQFGYRRDELIGQKVKNIIPQGFAERLIADGTRSAAEALAQQIGMGIELTGRRKDGSEFPIEIMLSPLDGVNGILVTAAIRDITERKRREYDMSCLVAVVESSHDAIIGLTPEGIVLTWNHGAERIYGYPSAEAVGRSIVFTSPPDRPLESLSLLEGVRRGETLEPFETIRVKKDGTRIHVSVTLSPIKDSDGQVVGVSAVARDVTESKNLEAMLRQAQKMEAVGQLAGGVAHDFNNLLGVILGYTGLLLDRMITDDPQRKSIEEIQKAGDRAALLTRQLLAFSRKQVLQPEILDLNTVVAGAEKLLQRLIGEDIELHVILNPALGRIEADAGQLEQIIMNLAVNARDAMPPGGKLTIETSNVEIDEDYAVQHPSTRTGPHVMLSVTDTGCGMDADTKAHMFEPFFTTKEFGKGTGLGLSTVYGIVKQSGGSVWVYSEVGIGSTFKIYLPCVSPALEIAAPSDKPEKIAGGLQTILIVEDEVPLLEVTHRSLEAFGYTILAAKSPAEAIQISRSHPGPIHLMVTDVIMPGMSGAQLSSRLSVSRPEMKVLYVSGYTDDTIVRHGVLERGLAFLQKPFSPRTLARKVSEVLATALV
jgi:two-component system, cell cycle sensor histidine kinase and response regulator CckA